jgi:hypothetical protein
VQWVFGEKIVRSLASTGFQVGHEYVAVHRKSVLRRTSESGVARNRLTPSHAAGVLLELDYVM